MNKKMILSIAAFAVFAFNANGVLASCEVPMNPNLQPQMGGYNCPNFNAMPQERMEQIRKEHEKRKAEMDARLKLTEEQKCIIEKNRQESRQKMKPLFEDLKTKKMKLNEINNSTLSKEEKDKQINALKSDIHNLKTQLHKLREENMKNFEAILTPQQKVEFKKMRQEHKKHRHNKHEKPYNQTSQAPYNK